MECHMNVNNSATICSLSRMELESIAIPICNTNQEMLAKEKLVCHLELKICCNKYSLSQVELITNYEH